MNMDKMDYIDKIEIAKTNLTKKLNDRIDEYKKERTAERKKEIAELMQDKREIYLSNKRIIEKYI